MTSPKQTAPAKKPTILTRNVVAIAAPIKHPEPPAHLTTAQAQVWTETVRALDDVDAIGIAVPEVIKAADKILAMHERQVRAASSLATRIRITLQATPSADEGKPQVKPARPWEQN